MKFMLFALLGKEKSGTDDEEAASTGDSSHMGRTCWVRWDKVSGYTTEIRIDENIYISDYYYDRERSAEKEENE